MLLEDTRYFYNNGSLFFNKSLITYFCHCVGNKQYISVFSIVLNAWFIFPILKKNGNENVILAVTTSSYSMITSFDFLHYDFNMNKFGADMTALSAVN